MEMQNKVCLITGASSGMGKAIATLFARDGARLILNGRDEAKGRALTNELGGAEAGVYFCAGDVGKPETNRLLVEKALLHFGRLDVVVANAGVLGLGSVTEVNPETWHDTIAVNLHAVYYLCREALPVMKKNGGGSIVVNASIAAFKSFPNHPAYCASKAGVVALVRQMALDYGPDIRVNAMCPGPVDTPFIWESAVAFPDPEKVVQAAGEKTALKRLGMPRDVAALARFLASDQSSFITGAAITIDGGATLT